jgi:hypothetical protein
VRLRKKYENKNDNYKVKNIKISLRSEVSKENGKKSRKSEKFQTSHNKNINEYDYKGVELHDFPGLIIFKDGWIYNKDTDTFFCGSDDSEGYRSIPYKNKRYKIHRIICYAYNPLPDKKCYNDYEGIQVNHKKKNTSDNMANNLEWVTASENIIHSQEVGTNKKCKPVIQYDKETKKEIGRFKSIAEASRKTGETDYNIRNCCNKENIPVGCVFYWRFS